LRRPELVCHAEGYEWSTTDVARALEISLVTIPIKVFPATESAASIGFNQLHSACQTRIQQKRWCPHCAKEVASSEIVKGHEFERGRYVVLDETDFDQVHTPSTRVIDLAQFSKADALDPMYIDRTYYLAPDGDMAAEAYAVMREGLRGYVGVGKLAMYGREYLVAVRAVARTITLHTLHHAAELRSIEAVTELRTVPAIAAADQVSLARQVISAFSGAARPHDVPGRVPRPIADHYRREDRRQGDHDCAGGRVATGGQLDGRPETESRNSEPREEDAGEGRRAGEEAARVVGALTRSRIRRSVRPTRRTVRTYP
jgi:DNA end-binding protein Ku